MENASDALYMAGSVLIFIIALTITISSFTIVRAGIDRTVGQTETVQISKNSEGYINYIQSRDNGATRVVGIETVISSIYRTLKENYIVYVQLKNDTDYNGLILPTDINIRMDVDKNVDGKKILKFTINKNDDILHTNDQYLSTSEKYRELMEILYKKLKNRKFNEYLGEYQSNAEGVADENKIKNRIITYIEK